MTDLLKKRGVQNITLQPEFLPKGIEQDMKQGMNVMVRLMNRASSVPKSFRCYLLDKES